MDINTGKCHHTRFPVASHVKTDDTISLCFFFKYVFLAKLYFIPSSRPAVITTFFSLPIPIPHPYHVTLTPAH